MDDATTPQKTVAVTTRRSARSRGPGVFTLLVPLAFVLGLGAGYLIWSPKSSGQSGTAGQPQAAVQPGAQETPRQVTRYDVPTDDDPSIGPASAPITIIEFSDYQCPYCTKWQEEVLPLIQKAYPDQVRLVYRDFPLTGIHPEAFPAAEAANCAGEQDAYWAYHDKLFGEQYGLGAEAYQKYATDLGLDLKKFNDCISSQRYQGEINGDLNFATSLGVRSTPTFFINGIALVGAQPFEVFKELIDKELAGEIPK